MTLNSQLATVLLLVSFATATAHPDKIEDRLLLHFATGVHAIRTARGRT